MILVWVADIHAGFPSPAEGYEDQQLDLNELFDLSNPAIFIYTMQGNSLVSDHICDGAKLIIDRSQASPTNYKKLIGWLVVGEQDGETVVCRLRNGYPQRVVGVVTWVLMGQSVFSPTAKRR